MKNSEKYKTPKDRAKAFIANHKLATVETDDLFRNLIAYAEWLDEEKLQDCPHCSGLALVVRRSDFFFVQCGKCGARSADCRDKNAAIENWNKRA